MTFSIPWIILFLGSIAAALGCGGDFTDESGFFISPDYPSDYPNSQECTYNIKTGYPVIITCHDFELQRKKNGVCSRDFMTITDGEGNDETYCGKRGPSSYESTGSTVTVYFESNRRGTNGGFNCSYESVIPDTTTTTTTTTTTPVPVLLQAALDARSSGACYPSRDTCGCDVTKDDSEYYETTDGNYRIVAANGIPNHDYEEGQERPNRNEACPNEVFMAIPLNPVKGNTYIEYPMGPVGIAISAAFFYNHLSNPSGDTAVYNEHESFDTCKGHSDGKCRYHYHELPVCLESSEDCTFIGYMRDGFPVYTYCKHGTQQRNFKSCYQLNSNENGSHQSHYTFNQTAKDNGECDLDMANGYEFPGSGYAYVFTENYPYIMAGYYGTELADICYIEAA